MNTVDWESDNNAKDLAKTDKLSSDHLQAMQLVARMREAADKAGAGFVVGFISHTGQRFMMSNMDENDVQTRAINQQLDMIELQRMLEIQGEDDQL